MVTREDDHQHRTAGVLRERVGLAVGARQREGRCGRSDGERRRAAAAAACGHHREDEADRSCSGGQEGGVSHASQQGRGSVGRLPDHREPFVPPASSANGERGGTQRTGSETAPAIR